MSGLQSRADGLGGKTKEAAGDAIGNDDPTDQGKDEQAASKVKRGAEDLKDKATETLGKLADK